MINLGLQTEMLQLHDMIMIKDSNSQIYPKFKKISTHQDSTDDRVTQRKLFQSEKYVKSTNSWVTIQNYLTDIFGFIDNYHFTYRSITTK